MTAYVAVEQPVLVAFSELYFTGWKLTGDEEPSDVWKAEYVFRGVVELGDHYFEPHPSITFQPAIE